jgi:hypothetical protein
MDDPICDENKVRQFNGEPSEIPRGCIILCVRICRGAVTAHLHYILSVEF